MPYTIQYNNQEYTKESSKDDIIQQLMGLLNGDGVVQIKITYPDGSYYSLTGEEEGWVE